MEFVKHAFQAHNRERNFLVKCGFSDCTRIFAMGTSFDAFRSHCSRYHNNWKEHFIPTMLTKEDGNEEETRSVCSSSEENMDISGTPGDNVSDITSAESVVESEIVNEKDVELAAAHFILVLKEKFKLTQTSLNYAIKGLEEISMLSATQIKHSVMSTLRESGSPVSVALHNCLTPANPFSNLKTEYQQNKFFKENFGLIVSVLCMYV